MVSVRNAAGATQSIVTAGTRTLASDTTPPAGKGDGVRPHQLLEAAVASCMAITLRMIADERGISLDTAEVTVELDRSSEEETVFRVAMNLEGTLSETEAEMLRRAVRRCPVRRTLAKRLAFADAPGSDG